MFTKLEIEKLISECETRIQSKILENEPLKKELEQATQMFNEASANYTKGMEGVIEEQKLLEKFVQLRNNDGVPVRILRQTSHLDKEPKRNLQWKPLIISALQSMNRYAKFDDIFSHMEHLNGPLDKAKFRGNTGRYEERKVEEFHFYKGKVGLKEWSENGVPKAGFIGQFIYKD